MVKLKNRLRCGLPGSIPTDPPVAFNIPPRGVFPEQGGLTVVQQEAVRTMLEFKRGDVTLHEFRESATVPAAPVVNPKSDSGKGGKSKGGGGGSILPEIAKES